MENNNNLNWNTDMLNLMSVIGFAIGLYNVDLNEKQMTNDELAKEVQYNRTKLEEQTEVFLKTIISQNNEIIKLLKGEK